MRTMSHERVKGKKMTDAMKGKCVTRKASAIIDPDAAMASYEWLDCGKCEFTGEKNGKTVTYGATNFTIDETVTVTHSGTGELYEKLSDGTLVLVEEKDYPAAEIDDCVFLLHGHEHSWDMRDGEIMIVHKNSGAVDLANYSVYNIRLVTPAGDPVSSPIDSGDGQNEFTYSGGDPGVLTMNLKAVASPKGMALRVKDQCAFTVGAIGDSKMAWGEGNPGGVPAVDGDSLVAKVTFTGLPEHNSDFGKKKAAISYRGEKFAERGYEVFFPKFAKNHPDCATCSGCSNWFYYWREGDVCSIPKDALWSVAEGIRNRTMGWCAHGTIYLTDLAANENDRSAEFASSFTIPSCEFSIETERRQFLDVTDKSAGEPGVAYYVAITKTFPDQEEHSIACVGGDGKGVGCAAQVVIHEIGHKTNSQMQDEAEKRLAVEDALVDQNLSKYGCDSIEYAFAKLKQETLNWSVGDGEYDGVTDNEERCGGLLQIYSDVEAQDTYGFADGFDAGSGYETYGDEEIRMRAIEPTAIYHANLDWSNPGCQYSNRPYGPTK